MSPAPPDVHALLDRFVDGELPPEEAERFRQHLDGCERCQAGLHERVQLAGLAQDALADAPPEAQVIRPARWRARAAAGVGMALAASLALVLVGRGGGGGSGGGEVDPSLWLASDSTRPLEARLSTPAADHHRPYGTTRGAEHAPPPPLPLLAKLEKKGELVAVAEAYLARGSPESARPYLDRAGQTPEALSTRAAMDLMVGQPEEALRYATRALALRPESAQAHWNRALALRALGLWLMATKDLDQVAAAGEPGWSVEAKQLMDRLDADYERRLREYDAFAARCGEKGSATPFPSDVPGFPPSLMRWCFDDALARAGTAEAVRRLAPAAEALDARYGGDAFGRRVKWALGHTRGREPLAREYAALWAVDRQNRRSPGPSEAALAALADRAQRQGQRDVEVVLRDSLAAEDGNAVRFLKLARAMADPWLLALANDKMAELEPSQERKMERLKTRVKDCAGDDRPELSCYSAEYGLLSAYEVLGQGENARALGLRVLERTRRENDPSHEQLVLMLVGRAARMVGDQELADAYEREASLRSRGR